MPEPLDDYPNYPDIRREQTCRGCGKPKSTPGCIVCWDCFKYRKDCTPYKDFMGSLRTWLLMVRTVEAAQPSAKKPPYQPKTGAKCSCKRGVQRDNCPNCEGTGMVIDFVAIRARNNRNS